MSGEFIIDTNAGQVAASVAKFPVEMKKEFTGALKAGGVNITRDAKLFGFSGPPRLTRRTGQMSRSQGYEMVGADMLLIFNTAKYAGVQEEGGTITAGKTSQYLVIPLAAAKTAAGVSRFASPLRSSALAGMNPFVKRSKSGNLILFATTGKGKKAQITPMFLLKKSVVIPPRFGLMTIIKDALPAIVDDIGDRAVKVWNKGTS